MILESPFPVWQKIGIISLVMLQLEKSKNLRMRSKEPKVSALDEPLLIIFFCQITMGSDVSD